MEHPMRKTRIEKRTKRADKLLKTSKKKDELREKELGQVGGGTFNSQLRNVGRPVGP
jgi:hypothetical protein